MSSMFDVGLSFCFIVYRVWKLEEKKHTQKIKKVTRFLSKKTTKA